MYPLLFMFVTRGSIIIQNKNTDKSCDSEWIVLTSISSNELVGAVFERLLLDLKGSCSQVPSYRLYQAQPRFLGHFGRCDGQLVST
jgi:hypothetical protein